MGGSSKSVTVGYKYYVGMHMALCHGPVDKLVRIRIGGNVAWVGNNTGGALTIDKPDLFGGEKREGGVSGQVDIEMGGPTQGQNGYLASKLGAALLPAFRGVCCAVLRQVYIGLNPYPKDWGWLMQRVHVRGDGREQWYPHKALVGDGITVQIFNDFYRTLDSWTEIASGRFLYPRDAEYDYGTEVNAGSFFYRGVFASKGVGPFGTFGFCNTYIPAGVKDRAIWVSKQFEVPAGRHRVTVDAWHDDGGVVWCDGVEVYRPGGGAKITTPGSASFEVDGGTHTVTLMAIDCRLSDAAFTQVGTTDNILAGISITVDYVSGGTFGGGAEGIFGDMNPSHIIRECLTDVDWGMGYPESDIDDVAFAAAADTLFSEQMGISYLWNQQTPIEDFVEEILRHIDAALYVDRSTGKFVLKLIRGGYVESGLLVLDKSNISRVEGYTKQTLAELPNEVTLSYNSNETGQTETITMQNLAMIQQQGAIIPASVEYMGFANQAIAAKVCARDLKAMSSPLASATLYANRTAAGLNIGDVFVWEWEEEDEEGAGVTTSYVMRVTEIAFGDGVDNVVRVQCVQDVFALPDITYVEAEPTVWENPSVAPLAAAPRLVTETPYYEIVRQLGEVDAAARLSGLPELGYLMVAAGRAGSEINAELQVDSGAGYAESGNLDFCPCAKLDGTVGYLDTEASLKDGVDLDEFTDGSLAQIDDEIIVIESIADGVATIRRGCLDTVPAQHADGAAIIIWDGYTATDSVEYVGSDELDVKILTITGQGSLALADAPVDSATMDQRALRPYPPADVKIGGIYYPVLVVADDLVGIVATWAHRDRTQQTGGTVAGWTEGSIGPEAGVTYSARLVRTDTEAELDSLTGITGTTATFTPSYRGEVRVEAWAVRAGLESFQFFEHTFLYTAVAPIYYESSLVHFDGNEVYYEL